MDRSSVAEHILIFKRVNFDSRFNYTQKDISEFSGIDRGVISRFLNGHNDISSSKFFALLSSMPKEFQREYWKALGLASLLYEEDDINWKVEIQKADKKTLFRIFSALADKHLVA